MKRANTPARIYTHDADMFMWVRILKPMACMAAAVLRLLDYHVGFHFQVGACKDFGQEIGEGGLRVAIVEPVGVLVAGHAKPSRSLLRCCIQSEWRD